MEIVYNIKSIVNTVYVNQTNYTEKNKTFNIKFSEKNDYFSQTFKYLKGLKKYIYCSILNFIF